MHAARVTHRFTATHTLAHFAHGMHAARVSQRQGRLQRFAVTATCDPSLSVTVLVLPLVGIVKRTT